VCGGRLGSANRQESEWRTSSWGRTGWPNRIHGQHLVGNSEQSVERRLDGVPTIDSDVAVQYLLQDLGIRNQALSIADQLFEQSLRVGLVRMRRANEIHWNVRIDQNHGRVPTPYPLSISAKMRSISPEG